MSLAAVARWRAPFLIGTLVVGVLLMVGLTVAGTWVRGVLFFLTLALYVGLVVGALVAQSKHPAELVEQDGDRVTVATPGLTLLAAAFTLMVTGFVANDIADALAGGLWTGDVVIDAVWTAWAGFAWYAALGPNDVRLGPDGLVERLPHGSMVVPWEALESATAGPRNRVTLTFRDRQAVVWRGLRRKRGVLNPTTKASYLADAINSAVRARSARR